MKNLEERNAMIYYERLQGVTYAELAEKYGITKTVAVSICSKEAKKISLASSPVYSALQAVNEDEGQNLRIYNSISRAGIITREEFIDCTGEFYRQLRGIGPQALEIILRAIEYCKIG